MLRRCVLSRIVNNEEAMTRVGSQRHRKKKMSEDDHLVVGKPDNLITILINIFVDDN